MKDSYFGKNMKLLRRRMPVLARLIDLQEPSGKVFHLAEAKNGSATLAVEVGGKSVQIHSKYDPEREAVQQIRGMEFKNPRLLIIFGLGFGYHIRAALKELSERNLFLVVVEKDIEAFQMAVKHADLADLFASEKIRWVVGVPDSEAYAVQHDMVKQAGIAFQLFLKTLTVFEHPALGTIDGEYYRTMLRAFREAAHTIIFNYGNCPRDSMVGVENIMKNLDTIMKNPGVKDLQGAFRGVPGILVSTGPSLDRNIEDLRQAIGKCVIVSADSALKVLYERKMKPHAVATLERIIEVAHLFDPLPPDAMDGVWLAGTPVILPEVYDVWKGPTFMVYRTFAHFEWLEMPKGTLNIGPSCSNMAFKILESMGCDPIILIGQDCSFTSEEKTHAEGAPGVTKLSLKKEDLFPVKGNVQETVYTDSIFELFRKTFVTDVATYRGTCINATEGGAFIEGTKIMPLKEAIAKYCRTPVDVDGIMNKKLHFPSSQEILTEWKRFRNTMIETRKEVEGVIEFCDKGEKLVSDFEKELETAGFAKMEDFLERFPEERLDEVHAEMTKARGQIILFGKYFNLYLMHIVQMIIVKFEMDFNELPSLCEDEKRCKLQAIRMMKRWFPTIGDVCRLSLNLLEEAFKKLEAEFGNPREKDRPQ